MTDAEIDAVWDALRERVSSSKLEAKRCVMVSRADLAHAMRQQGSAVFNELQKLRRNALENARNMDRWILVCESAVRWSDPGNRDEVLAAFRANRAFAQSIDQNYQNPTAPLPTDLAEAQ